MDPHTAIDAIWGELNPEIWQRRGPTYGRNGPFSEYNGSTHLNRRNLERIRECRAVASEGERVGTRIERVQPLPLIAPLVPLVNPLIRPLINPLIVISATMGSIAADSKEPRWSRCARRILCDETSTASCQTPSQRTAPSGSRRCRSGGGGSGSGGGGGGGGGGSGGGGGGGAAGRKSDDGGHGGGGRDNHGRERHPPVPPAPIVCVLPSPELQPKNRHASTAYPLPRFLCKESSKSTSLT